MDLAGKPLIVHVVDRVRQIRGIHHIVLATPMSDALPFSNVISHPGVRVLAPGCPNEDVLSRFAHVLARYPDCDTVMRLTGDCPLLDPHVCESVLALYRSDPHVEYAWNCAPGYVDGEDCEVFAAAALKWAQREARDPFDREHVGPWMRRHVKTATMMPDTDRGFLKTSVDTQEDLDRVRQMVVGC
jgi:spore coat polysaccharide biosynthesis protein SpsF (cytidylyltransferase family)